MKIYMNPVHNTLELQLRALQAAALTSAAEMPTAAPTSPGPHTTGCLGAAQSLPGHEQNTKIICFRQLWRQRVQILSQITRCTCPA